MFWLNKILLKYEISNTKDDFIQDIDETTNQLEKLRLEVQVLKREADEKVKYTLNMCRLHRKFCEEDILKTLSIFPFISGNRNQGLKKAVGKFLERWNLFKEKTFFEGFTS